MSKYSSIVFVLMFSSLVYSEPATQERVDELKKVSVTEPMFVIAQFNVKDFPKYFEQYGSHMNETVAKFGGRFLAASRDAVSKEGVSSGNFTAIIRFPSKESALAMYESPDYAPLKLKRIEELTDGGNLIFIPGLGMTEPK